MISDDDANERWIYAKRQELKFSKMTEMNKKTFTCVEIWGWGTQSN